MHVSSTLCFAQEALQRQRASDSAIANVRAIAVKAAAAWHLEGIAAVGREKRQLRVQAFKANELRNASAIDELLLSENPDRGLA